jgi:hypothetical protein
LYLVSILVYRFEEEYEYPHFFSEPTNINVACPDATDYKWPLGGLVMEDAVSTCSSSSIFSICDVCRLSLYISYDSPLLTNYTMIVQDAQDPRFQDPKTLRYNTKKVFFIAAMRNDAAGSPAEMRHVVCVKFSALHTVGVVFVSILQFTLVAFLFRSFFYMHTLWGNALGLTR